MRRIKITLDYIGTAYDGWQRQPGRDTVQQRVEDAIFSLSGERVSVTASGRTDAGVHALGQVAHFDVNTAIPVKNYMTGVNHFLPPDIRILKAEEVTADFHARFSVHEKTYTYCLYESRFERACYLNRAARADNRLDVAKMKRAAKAFEGTHDFTSFCSSGADTTTFTRTIKSVYVRRSGGLVKISVTADGFLYNMVRRVAAVLVRAGYGQIDCDGVKKLLAAADNKVAKDVMPACGLYLESVVY